MAVPSSGPLKLRGDINLEVNGNVTDTNVALHQLSLDAGFSAPDAMSDFYGYSSVVPPSVISQGVQSIDPSSQTLLGCVTNTGGENVSRGFYFGTSTTRTSNPKITEAGTHSVGGFSLSRYGLTQGTTYYNWAFACNSAGESVGNRCSANTGYPPYTPTLTCACLFECGAYSVSNYTGNASGATFQYGCTGWVNPYSSANNTLLSIAFTTTADYCTFTCALASCTAGSAKGVLNFWCAYGCSCANTGVWTGSPPIRMDHTIYNSIDLRGSKVCLTGCPGTCLQNNCFYSNPYAGLFYDQGTCSCQGANIQNHALIFPNNCPSTSPTVMSLRKCGCWRFFNSDN